MPHLTFEQYDCAPTPEQIQAIYSSGFRGVLYDAPSRAFLARAAPTFYDAFPQAKDHGAGKVSLPFRAALALEPEYGRYESQTTGDCVSHSTRNAGMIDYCVDATFGETTYEGRFATENIYGYRGHGGQGADCSRLATYVSPDGPGGFLVRKSYESDGQSVDLSRYNSSIGHNWGRPGTPAWLNKIAAENKGLSVMRCTSKEMARDAIASGFGLSRCGWLGFSSKRNEDGVSEPQGSWSHAMAWVGVDDTDWAHQKYGGMLVLCQNSWGLFNSGPKRQEQPDGSFWYREKHMVAEINAGGVYVIASVRGYNRELVYDTMSRVEELSRA